MIGFTYDLRDDYISQGFSEEETAEFDSPETISAIESSLNNLGFKTDRIGNFYSLVKRLINGEKWDLVFNIAEGIYGIGREAQVPAVLDAYRIPYTFSDPMVLSLCLHKGMTKRVVRSLGVPTADFHIVENESDIEDVKLPFPLFAKPIAEGTGKGVNTASKIHTKDELNSVCLNLLNKFNQPVLIETFLPGREFTVGIIGTGKSAFVVGAIEVIFKESADGNIYSLVNKENWKNRIEYRLVNDELAQKAKEIALIAWRGLGCRDGGRIDIRVDSSGVPNFVEVNPLAGLRPKYSDFPIICSMVGIEYQEMIDMIMKSAMKRINK